MLRAYGEALGRGDDLLYRHLNVHGYWGLGGGKMSKSVGNVVEALALKDRYGNDAFRYFVMREMVFGLDADFSEEAFVGRLNADLANDLGNLVARATTLVARAAPAEKPQLSILSTEDQSVRIAAGETRHLVERAMSEFAFSRALGQIWEFIAVLNRYIDTTQPWALAKDPARLGKLNLVLVTLTDSLRFLGIVLQPFLPDSARRIREALGDERAPNLENAAVGRIDTIPPVTKLSGLFPRVEDKKVAAKTVEGTPAAGAKITLADFGRIELRVADIEDAPSISSRVPRELGGDYVSQDWADMNEALFSALWLEKMAISITIGLIVMVAALNIIASLVLLVMEKSRDIAILKTMGTSPRRVMTIFMLQGLVIGVVGTTAGASAGLALCWVLDRYRLIQIPMDVYQIAYVPFVVQPLDFAVVVISAIVICFLATIYPSRQASRLDPVQALRFE